ncbi:uncharacterized protein J8A68_005162 [[Candida] subhashii]|uniref:Uncharacterized protein n=1 Tax=[Candida] subhashii TaxID=561895 RepID=A0A8J5UU38_9ASCO|nr:uncharacterized protein J8A68_005162 [[Candida] subhashii]KAG7661370.1 hypothetical protein J8A68_005162 [[Candida] subhashii]
MTNENLQAPGGTKSSNSMDANSSHFYTGKPPANLIKAVQEYNMIDDNPKLLIANIVQLRKRHSMVDIVRSIREGIKQAGSRVEKKFRDVTDDEFVQMETCSLGHLDCQKLGDDLSSKYKKLDKFIEVRRCFQNALVYGVGNYHVRMEPFPPTYIESDAFTRIQQTFITYIQQIHFTVDEEPFHLIFDLKDLSYELFLLKTNTTKVQEALKTFISSVLKNGQLVIVEIPQPEDLETVYVPEQDYCYSYIVVKSNSGAIDYNQPDVYVKKHNVEVIASPEVMRNGSLSNLGSDNCSSFSEMSTPSEVSLCGSLLGLGFGKDYEATSSDNRQGNSEIASVTKNISSSIEPNIEVAKHWTMISPLTGAIPRDYLREICQYSIAFAVTSEDCISCRDMPPIWEVAIHPETNLKLFLRKSVEILMIIMHYLMKRAASNWLRVCLALAYFIFCNLLVVYIVRKYAVPPPPPAKIIYVNQKFNIVHLFSSWFGTTRSVTQMLMAQEELSKEAVARIDHSPF